MATNKRIRRETGSALSVAAAVAMLVAPVLPTMRAAEAGDWMPLLPDQDFYDFQLFAPPDLQEYNIYKRPHEGIFFSYDRLYWGITIPRTTPVAETPDGNYLIPYQPISPQTVVQLNNANLQATTTSGTTATGGSIIGGLYTFGTDPLQLDLNTSWMMTKMGWGDRYEGGWIYDDRGVALSYFNLGQQQEFKTLSEFAASSPTQTFTQDGTTGGGTGGGGGGVGNVNQALVTTTITSESPPPDHIIAQKLTQENSVEIQSASAALIIRRDLGKRGSGTTARFGLGPRFLQFAERYKLGYESNQYSFNIGGGAGGTGTGGTGTGGAGTGTGTGTGAGGGTGGTANQQQNQNGGTLTNNTDAIGGGGVDEIFGTGPAGNVLGITGVDSLTGQGLGSPLQTGMWDTFTSNNMVGPEFSLYLEAERGRWLFSSELKFTAAFNWQNNIYKGSNFPESLGADYLRATFTPSTTFTAGGTAAAETLNAPPLFLQIYGVGQQNAKNSAEHQFVFSPIGEWRFGGQFRVSKSINLNFGYTGMWLGAIARASSNTGYVTEEKRSQFAAPVDPTQPASIDNPWVVKTTGPSPGNMPTTTNAQGQQVPNPYYVPNPKFTGIGAADGGSEYVFTNGIDFGLEVKF
jgi:hypothetical protein